METHQEAPAVHSSCSPCPILLGNLSPPPLRRTWTHSGSLSINISTANDETGNCIISSKTPNKYSSPLALSSFSPVKSSSNQISAPFNRSRASSFGSIGAAMVKDCNTPKASFGDFKNLCGLTLLAQGSSPHRHRNSPVAAHSEKSCCEVLGIDSDVAIQGVPLAGSDTPSRRAQHALPDSSPLSPPLPKGEVDWLLSTLSEPEQARFLRPLFSQDCRMRFQELDTDGSGFLNEAKLQAKLFVMFPTLRLDLFAPGHCISALDNSIPNLIATFDADMDGYIGREDFIELMKFCQAWRKHFYLDIPPRHQPLTMAAARRAKFGKDSDRTLGEDWDTTSPSAPDLLESSVTAAQHQSASSDTPEQGLGKKPSTKVRGSSSKSATLHVPKSGSDSSKGKLPRASVSAIFGSSSRQQNASRPTSSASATSGMSGMSGSRSSRPNGPLDSTRGSFYSTFYGVSWSHGS